MGTHPVGLFTSIIRPPQPIVNNKLLRLHILVYRGIMLI
jgi:hypothetical protein